MSEDAGGVRIYVLGSGSSGNCLVIEAEGERLLVDAGMGPCAATERMRVLGADLIAARAPLGLFVTHHHGDHAGARAPARSRPARAGLCARRRAARVAQARRGPAVRAGASGAPRAVRGRGARHSARRPHVALRVSAGGRRFGIATDLGHATRELRLLLQGCDLVMLEANHCPAMLEAGPYPPRLKRRVAGPLGHLANEQAAELAAALEDTRVSRLVLAHLSRTNNSPERALDGGRQAPAPVACAGPDSWRAAAPARQR